MWRSSTNPSYRKCEENNVNFNVHALFGFWGGKCIHVLIIKVCIRYIQKWAWYRLCSEYRYYIMMLNAGAGSTDWLIGFNCWSLLSTMPLLDCCSISSSGLTSSRISLVIWLWAGIPVCELIWLTFFWVRYYVNFNFNMHELFVRPAVACGSYPL